MKKLLQARVLLQNCRLYKSDTADDLL